MNVTKKTIAMIIVALVVMRLFVINVSASFAAPVMAEETLKLLFIEALSATGSYSADDLEAWEYEDLRNEFDIQMTTNPNFNAKKVLPVLVSDDLSVIPGSPEDIAKKEAEMIKFREQTDKAVSDWLNYMQSSGEDLYDFINPTYNIPIDMQGNGCVLVIPFSNYPGRPIDRYRVIYGEYGIIGKSGNETQVRVFNVTKIDVYDLRWNLQYSQGPLSSYMTAIKSNMERYGDWSFEDGTKVDTDDEPIPVIGEVAGTQVTPDMLNPDGSVTIGGTTYYPKDFIDWDKFKDPAIIDLLNKILAKIDDMPVISEQDKPIVDVDSVEIAVPDELSDYTVPAGISSVFPFCLPFDFSRGIKMLLAEPEVPVFKTEINMTDFCGFDLGVVPLEISLEKWEPAVVIIRWFNLLLFIISLIFISTKIVKGAGA